VSVDRRIVYGLTLITLAMVGIQVKVVTVEAVASLVLGTMTLVAALLASPPGSGGEKTSRDAPACPHDRCPLAPPRPDPGSDRGPPGRPEGSGGSS
jgi:hypothetical protein